MEINLNTLYKPIEIDDTFEIPESFYKSTSIKELKEVHAKGRVGYNISDEIELNLEVSGIMYLEDGVTLEKIKHPFSFEIDEILEENREENQEYLKKGKNILDIIEILWENIVLEVPISITNASNMKKNGEGWQLNGEAEEEGIDPRLAKLNDLFKGGE